MKQNNPDFPDTFDSFRTNSRALPRFVGSTDELDLKKEIALVYSNAQALFDTIAQDFETPANQKAQTLNTCLSILKEVIKAKEALYNITEVSEIEAALGKTLQNYPEIREAFLEDYRGNLNL